MTYILMDIDNGNIIGVITTQTTTAEELHKIVDEAKEAYEENEKAEFLTDIIKEKLPADCELNLNMSHRIIWF